MGKFYNPKELESIFEAKAGSISPSEFIRKPQHKELKEMWSAVRFGLGYEKFVGPCSISVGLEENSDADFFLKADACEFPFQTRIADVPERRMGDDYKPEPDGTLPARPYEPERGRIEGPGWIATAVKEKAEKRYSTAKNLNLLIYANFSAHDLDYKAVCDEVREYSDEFASIWIITNHQICSIKKGAGLGEIVGFRAIYSPEEILSML
ncbi:MAG: hypothetical protein GQ522_03145 [Deltaproteobacteria bacterium]|nr:hypothetical protein [Deltaproteobacteria bacterium]